MRELETDRLLLRAWRDDDADAVFDMYARWEVQRYIGRVPQVMQSRDEAVARIERWRELDDPVRAIWAVEVRDTGRLAGALLLKEIPASGSEEPLRPSGDTEIGWHLHPDAWGHGYATEAASAALAHAFAGGLTRVIAVTNLENLASQRVCLRLGMTHLGRTGAYYDTECELFAIER